MAPVPLKVIYIDCFPVALFVDSAWKYSVMVTESNLSNLISCLKNDADSKATVRKPIFVWWDRLIANIDSAVAGTRKEDVVRHVRFNLIPQRFTKRTKKVFCDAAGTTLRETFPLSKKGE